MHRLSQGCRRAGEEALTETDTERMYNILQWYSTAVIDMRVEADIRLAESLVCPAAQVLAALPFRDDALVIGKLPSADVDVLHGRVARCIYTASASAVQHLLQEFPFLAGNPSANRRVLPNLVDTRLVLGHQGHAFRLRDWAVTLELIGVVNLASNRVPSTYDAIADRKHYVDVTHSDGQPLTDTSNDGQRFSEVLPQVLEAIELALVSNPQGRIFIHCQQGRSRAGSVAAARLLVTHPSWTLLDAVRFLSLRRPEVELNMSYAEVLDEFAQSLGRTSSLDQLKSELPKHLRAAGVARDCPDRCSNEEPLP